MKWEGTDQSLPVGPAGKPLLVALNSRLTQLVGLLTAPSPGALPGYSSSCPVPQAAGPLLWLLGARGALHPERGHQAD